MGSKNKRVASPESVPIHLNCGIYVHHLTFIYEHIYHEKNKLESSLCRLNSAGSNTMPVSNSAAAPSIFPIDMLTVKKNEWFDQRWLEISATFPDPEHHFITKITIDLSNLLFHIIQT